MAKTVKALVKLQIKGGGATPAPPVGTALGPHGLNIQDFCTQFNAATADRRGEVVPCILTIYEDRSFDFILKKAPVAEMLKTATKLKKGSGKPNVDKVGTISKAAIRKIAEAKMPDLNCHTVEAAMNMVEGTAKQMGLTVV